MQDNASIDGDEVSADSSQTGKYAIWRFGGAWWVHKGGPVTFPVNGPYDSKADAQRAKDALDANPFLLCFVP